MNGVMIETDILIDFLLAGEGERSLFRRLLEVIPCYSTFLNAAELYSAARSEEELRVVERALFGLKILGASSRYAKTIGSALTSQGIVGDRRGAIIAGMALESSLPVVTGRAIDAFAQVAGLRVIAAADLLNAPDREALLELLARPPLGPPGGGM